MTRVLILCTGNSSRSQMAEAFLRSINQDIEVFSAGTEPALTVHPAAVRVMRETGIDLQGARPKSVGQFLGQSFDHVITVCDHARETCPVFTGPVRHRHHLGFDDPAAVKGSEDAVLREFRRVRDEIAARFTQFNNDYLKRDPHGVD